MTMATVDYRYMATKMVEALSPDEVRALAAPGPVSPSIRHVELKTEIEELVEERWKRIAEAYVARTGS